MDHKRDNCLIFGAMTPFAERIQPLDAPVIRILLRQQMDKKAFAERRRITINEVAKETGISRTTLSRIANVPDYNTNTDTIDALCQYFNCSVSELVERVAE